ncbi:MAG: M1 family metallopeptidase [Sphingobacteriaceae bacterium]|nr:M1 family metallopeptidase [Sphingobacteriaceae bacterium]
MKKIGIVLILTLIINSTFAQKKICYQYDAGAAMREHNLDFERMRLSVEFEPEKGLVKGKITHFFTPIRATVDSFFLDGPGINIKEAKLNGKDIKYKTDVNGISFFPDKTLKWGEKDSLAIIYEATPRKGLYFIGWNDPNNLSRKQIWSQGQGIDNRHWFPCYDTPNDKLLTEVYVKFNKDYKVLSNGVKVIEKETKDGNKLWHYKMNHPHQSYLVMLGIGKYEIKESKSKSGVPMYSWYYPEWKNRVEWTYKYNEKIFDFLESEIGVPYQWETYSQIPVQDFMFGAMENTTATLFGDFFCADSRGYNDRNYVAVNAHELAHQWFGDFVSARSGNSHWLQESFATHYNVLAERECFGQDHFDWQRRQAGIAAINVQDKKSISHSETSSTLIYQKGSQVLEMLKYIVGREGYNKSVKRYLLAHKYDNVDSDDLLNAFQDELGYGLEWFWDEWVYRGGEPIYNVAFDDFTQTDGKHISQFMVTQTQAVSDISGLFKMPIAFEVYYTDGTKDSKTEWIEKESHVVKISNQSNKKIDFVLFDPNSEVMKTVTFNKSFEMLTAQALRAPKMIDRYDAVLAMRKISPPQKKIVLTEVYNKNTFHAIKSEAAAQLLEDKSEESIQLVKKALTDADVQVRKAILMSTKSIEPNLLSDYEKLLLDSSYQTIVTALEKLCNNFPENTQKYLDITKGIEGTNGRNVICKWLEIAAAASNNDKKHINQLVAFTSNSYEFITRGNAMNALRKLNYIDETMVNNCIEACLSSNGRLAGPANETIKYFYAQTQFKKLISETIKKRNSKNW